MNTEIINQSTYIENEEIIHILEQIFDPEHDFSIYDMGLVYKVIIDDNQIHVIMTLTTINCPEAHNIPVTVEQTIQEIYKDLKVSVEIVFEPPWTVDNMSEELQLKLGLL